MKKTLIAGTVAVAGFLAVGFMTVNAMMIPDVLVSYSSNHCTKVINYGDSNYSCENMPTKFNHVWVK
jgi:hypothetical protein|tara:strand:- start:531 stop:731 length:201 start_codon:yes stop_codon:yes gene_type:complete